MNKDIKNAVGLFCIFFLLFWCYGRFVGVSARFSWEEYIDTTRPMITRHKNIIIELCTQIISHVCLVESLDAMSWIGCIVAEGCLIAKLFHKLAIILYLQVFCVLLFSPATHYTFLASIFYLFYQTRHWYFAS